ncbi:hypothetical protein JNUCC1_00430 [Lentibacillus sp. JNUCC-1]|uniref:hypothetical protein n=1 Tax=Lentibacillus sp. JNUCC-1 TaxID=2654513 RepID=UPI0012E89502|nr:hypothetical protein [Lentibacillus sp. JNUCC-1]MUV36627.1 hypothetical protein [Lentibacillus sp. JNUCC-1]
MQNFKILQLLDLISGIFKALKIDYPTMRKILQVKLTMDQRRVPTMFQANMTEKKEKDNQLLKSLGIYVLYGLILVPFLFLGDYYFEMSLFFGVSMFILMTSLISDFSSVLLDVRDKTLLNTKPVDERTVNAAKFVHVVIYISQLTGAFLFIPLIVAIFAKGILFFLLLIAEIVLLVLFVVALTALIYIYILQFFTAEKLRDIINYVQILLSVSIVIGYQIVIRMFEFTDMNFVYTFEWWHVVLPPIWFAGPFDLFFQSNQSGAAGLMTVLAIVVPISAFMLYYRLVPSFERNLQKLMSSSSTSKGSRWNLSDLWARMLCRSREEQSFFRFSASMIKRERDFKLRVYPSLGMALVFPFIFLMNFVSMESFDALRESNMHFNIYFTAIVIGPVVYMLRHSSRYKGSWIFFASPIKNKSMFYSATLKAFLILLYFPVYFVVAIAFVWIFSGRIIPDLIAVAIAIILQTLISYKLTNNDVFPFSRPFETAQQAGSTMKFFLMMFFTGIFFVFHWLSSKIDYGVYIYIAILLIATIVSWKMVFRQKKMLIDM